MGLLSGLLVNGIRNTGSTALSRAIGSAVGSGVGGLGGGGGAGAGNNPYPVDPSYVAPRPTKNVNNAQPGLIDDITVTAPAVAPALDGAVGNIVGNAGANLAVGGPQSAGSTTVDGLEVRPEAATQDPGIAPGSAVADALGLSGPVDVGGLDVVAPRPPALPSVAGVAPLITGNMDLNTIGSPEITAPGMERVTEDAKDPIGIQDVAMLAPLAAAGLIATGSTMPAAGAITGAPTDGGLPLGVKPTDIIAGGLLGAGLLGGTGGTGSAGDAIKDLAASNKELAGRLGGIAEAGFQGNIGAKGLNSISRMVRKAQAAIRQRYAAMNMSGSTAEGDDLNAAVESGVDLQFKIGQQMAQTGLNAVAALTGQSAQAYLSLLNAQTQKDTALGNALANFAAAVAR